MLAFITGSGFYEHESLETLNVSTPFGEAELLQGQVGNRKMLMLSRHAEGHRQLPHQINHRANLSALKQAGASAIVSCSVCGVLNPGWGLGKPLTTSDIYYPDNRLGDGSTCSIFQTPGELGRGHLLAGSLLHTGLTDAIQKLSQSSPTGVYGHVSGPRFNTKSEIKALQNAGVDFISQTCGPEAVLANELEVPYALAAFGIDYANGVSDIPTPVETLQANLEKSKTWFRSLMENLQEPEEGFTFQNFVYRFE